MPIFQKILDFQSFVFQPVLFGLDGPKVVLIIGPKVLFGRCSEKMIIIIPQKQKKNSNVLNTNVDASTIPDEITGEGWVPNL